MLVSMDQLTHDTRLTGRGIDRVQIGHPTVVVDACQVKRSRGVVEVEADGAVGIKTKRTDRRHLSGVFVYCEEPVTQNIDTEHPTNWIRSDADNRHALWNAKEVTDYGRRYFVTSVDASKEEICVGRGREVIRANSE